jgi:hypothetical protein
VRGKTNETDAFQDQENACPGSNPRQDDLSLGPNCGDKAMIEFLAFLHGIGVLVAYTILRPRF